MSHALPSQPAYILFRTDDLNAGEAIASYIRSVDQTLEMYGAEILIQNLPARVLEGEWGGFVTLLRFRDCDAAEAWYDSAEYGAIRHLRQNNSTPTGILVQGVAPGHRSSDLADIFGLAG